MQRTPAQMERVVQMENPKMKMAKELQNDPHGNIA